MELVLHKAIENTYTKKGFRPILCYDDGTVYISKKKTELPNKDEIVHKLMNLIESWIDERKDKIAKIKRSLVLSMIDDKIYYKYDI